MLVDRFLRSALVATCLFGPCWADAQETVGPERVEESGPVEGSEPAEELGGYASASQGFADYLDLMARHRVDLVVESGLFDEVSRSEERQAALASQLYEILLRTEAPDPDRVRRLGEQGGRVAIAIRDEEGRRIETLALARGEDGRWRLAPNNADWIPRRAELLADAPLREEMLAELDLLDRQHRRLRAELPESLLRRSFVLENWQWIALGGVLALAVGLGRLVQALLSLAARRGAGVEGVLGVASELKRFTRPAGLFAAATIFGVLLPLAGLEGRVLAAIAFAARFVGTFAGLWATYRAVDLGCGILEGRAKRSRNRFDDILVPLLRTTLHVFVVIIGVVYLAAEWTDQLWSIVAGLSIGSLAIGFAARDSIENLFGTFTVLVDKPFALGDWIVVDGIEGTVESVGFRSTRVRTFWDSLLSVPNRKFISGVVENYGHRRKRRIKTTLRLALDTPADLVDAFCEGVRQLITHHPASVPSNYVYLYDLGEDALEVLLYTFVQTPDWDVEMREKHRLLADILRLADRLGVRIAAPARTIELERGARPGPADVGQDPAAAGRAAADSVWESVHQGR